MEKLKLFRIFTVKGVPIYMHWSLTLVWLVGILGSFNDLSFFLGAASFWGIMLLHELGHMWFASRRGLATERIELYLFHGFCHYEAGRFDYDNHIVAWGGVVAQLIVAIPAIVIFSIFGNDLQWYINTPLIFFGYFSLIIVFLNLLPKEHFDGFYCWRAIPLYFKYRKRMKTSNKKRSHLKSVK